MFYLLPKAWKYPQRSPAQEQQILDSNKCLLQAFVLLPMIEDFTKKM
jgi:hypothetical protein